MKKTFFYLLAILFTAGILSSCEKEYSEENQNQNTSMVTGDFRAKINGTDLWIANEIAIAKRNNGSITLTGKRSDGKMLVMTLIDSGAHVYRLDENSSNVALWTDTSLNQFPFTTNGTGADSLAGGKVTVAFIDTVNKRISGTFEFRVFNSAATPKSINLMQGFFTDISYDTVITTPTNPNPNPNPIPGGNDTLNGTKDGAAWAATSFQKNVTAGTLSITGLDAAMNSLTITLDQAITPGTYTFGTSPMAIYTSGTSGYMSSGGTLTVLSNTGGRIRANYSFTGDALLGTGQVSFTNGYLSIKYQ